MLHRYRGGRTRLCLRVFGLFRNSVFSIVFRWNLCLADELGGVCFPGTLPMLSVKAYFTVGVGALFAEEEGRLI